jgi:phosphoglycolate phosphatase-like HAD superfamily hydrolase
MDGCVYPYPDDFPNHCNETAVAALFHIMDEPLPKDIKPWAARAKKSFQETGSPVKHFSEEFKIDFDQMDGVYHQLLNVDTLIPENDFAPVMLQAVEAGHKTHLATHSHEFFTTRALEVLGLSNVFQMQNNVFTLNQFGFNKRKCSSPQMIIDSLDCMEVAPEEAIFVEDTDKNFVPVKDHNPRITTILVARRGLPEQLPTHIDFAVSSATSIAQALPKRDMSCKARPNQPDRKGAFSPIRSNGIGIAAASLRF